MKILVNAVIFDMDGVITDTMPCHFKVWKKLFAREGIHVSHEDIYKREGQKGMESVREIFAEYKKEFNENYARQLLLEKEHEFKRVFKRKFIVGSRAFIKKLKRDGFRLGLVTGTSRQEAEKLLPADLMSLFDVTVCGCEVQNGKPHPEPYLKALKHLSIPPHKAVVFENAPFGIRSAKAAGLKCFAIETSLPKKFLTQADRVFGSYREILTNVHFIHDKI